MQYRECGRTGIKLSALGFGAMRLPMKGNDVDEEKSIEAFLRAYELGVNYYDTAPYYCNSQSEVVLGKFLKMIDREKVYISTKNPIEDNTAKGWRERLERSLKRLDVEYIDFYQAIWGANWATYSEKFAIPGGGLEAAFKAKEEGLIRHICCSFHDSVENLIKLIDTGIFEAITLQYNILDRSNEKGIAYAKEKGVGIIVMGPIGGGRLVGPSEFITKKLMGGARSTVEAALRFVLSNPGVTVALSGMNDVRQVEENVEIASRVEPLSEEEMERIASIFEETKKLADLYCTGCGYCMPCPNGVDIPGNFRAMNYYRVWDLLDLAKHEYNHLKGKNAHAEACLECGECEPKCPQNIQIIKQLKETAAALGR